jgi:hypothetical protein
MTLGVHSVIVEPIWAESESSATGETDGFTSEWRVRRRSGKPDRE